MLACTLGHFECAKLLMNQNASVTVDDDDGFNVLHEAIATNDPELVQLVLEKREFQRSSNRAKAIPALLRKIRDVSRFVVFALNFVLNSMSLCRRRTSISK